MTTDDHFTRGLTTDVFGVLERQAFGMVLEGARDTSYGSYLQPAPPVPPARPGPSGPDADAATLTDSEVTTVVAALDIAADFNPNRADACAGCADQSCLTCQSRPRDARAYGQMAVQMLQTAQAARAAKSGQPQPDTPPALPAWPHLAAEWEGAQ